MMLRWSSGIITHVFSNSTWYSGEFTSTASIRTRARDARRDGASAASSSASLR